MRGSRCRWGAHQEEPVELLRTIVASNACPSRRRGAHRQIHLEGPPEDLLADQVEGADPAGLSLSASTSPRRSRIDTIRAPRPLAVQRVLRM